jgi:succinate-semialdehyde dehydrogenase/glutarate-semialdehyde dehydrogenase
MIVCDDADLDLAAKAAAVGRFFNCGQACLAVKRLYVFANVYEAFMERFLPRVQRLKLGPGLEETTQMGPLHTERQRSLVEAQLQDALDRGGRILVGGRRPEGEVFRKGFFLEPTVILEPGLESRVAQEEVFGPVLPVWRVGSLEEAVELANRSPYGLGSSIFTRSLERASYALEKLEAGYTWVNSVNRIYDELPFGGVKESGYGKEHGLEALEFYQETKAGVVRWR